MFDSETFEYSIYITNEDEVNINAIANVEGTNIEITGNTGLVEGENLAIIKLTKDDKTIEYKIKITKTIMAIVEENNNQEVNEIEIEEDEKNKIGFIGSIGDWWNRSGPGTVTLTITLIMFGISTIFAIISYRYSKELGRFTGNVKVSLPENDKNIYFNNR